MKRFLSAIVLMIVSCAVFATGNNSGAAAGAAAIVNSTNFVHASAANRAVLEGQQDQSQSVFNGGNHLNNNFPANQRQLRNNPGIFLGMPNPTADCMAVVGGGAVFSGIGFTAAGSLANENCEIQEASRNMHHQGHDDLALEIACSGKHAKNTTQCLSLELRNVTIKRELEEQLAIANGKKQGRTHKVSYNSKVERNNGKSFSNASSWGGLHNF